MTIAPFFVNLASSVTLLENDVNGPLIVGYAGETSRQAIDQDAILQYRDVANDSLAPNFFIAFDVNRESEPWYRLTITGMAAGNRLGFGNNSAPSDGYRPS